MRTRHVSVVVFFAAGDDPMKTEVRQTHKRQRMADHFRQLEIVFRSARKFHPKLRGVLLTDGRTDDPGIEGIELVRGNVDVRKLVWHRLLAQQAFVETLAPQELCLFLDADMIVNRSIDPLWEIDQDVILTWQSKPNFINGGFIGVRGDRRDRALHFFDIVRSTFEERFSDQSGWSGDESALAAAHSSVPVEAGREARHHFAGYDVAFLPGRMWNWSPPMRSRSILYPYPEVQVLHFKGARKKLMERYWHLHLAENPRVRRQMLWMRTFLEAGFEAVESRVHRQ